MDKIRNALKCVNCKKILSSPINLPCGHMICKAHTSQTSNEQVRCAECDIHHPNKEYPVNEAVMVMIEAQLAEINFGNQHDEAIKSCDNLKNELSKSDSMLNDLDFFIQEGIEELKINILLKSEQIKLKIDNLTDTMLKECADYEIRCKENTEIQKFKILLENFQYQTSQARIKCNQWYEDLNVLKVNNNKWNEIKKDCDLVHEEFEKNFKHFIKELFLNDLDSKKKKFNYFDGIHFPLYEIHSSQNNNQYSLILNDEKRRQLFQLFKESLDNNQDLEGELTLLYRATRDGFTGKDFHSKCDDYQHTITLIQLTSGYILGGYTKCSWTPTENVLKEDPTSFIFSLVNKFEKPCLWKSNKSESTIFCVSNFGPSFAISDVSLCVEGNNSQDYSAGALPSSTPVHVSDSLKNFLSINEQFSAKAKEIEVFQINKNV